MVVPLAGTWIETGTRLYPGQNTSVVPLAGTWIETNVIAIVFYLSFVVPLAGTWIETSVINPESFSRSVVPLAGTWIETKVLRKKVMIDGSFPSRERGLKRGIQVRGSGFQNGRSPRGNVD